MGIHFGTIVATCSSERLLSELRANGWQIGPATPFPGWEEAELDPSEEGDPLVAGDFQGQAYVLDTALMVSGSRFDELVDISNRISGTVGSCYGETVSGSFFLLVAKDGELVRLYYNCHSAVTKPLSIGEPLSSESEWNLEDIDGNGLFAVFREFGFDFDQWQMSGTQAVHLLGWSEDEQEGPAGPLTRQVNEHLGRFKIPPGEEPKPTVVARDLGDGSVGYDIVSQPSEPSLFSRFMSFFKVRQK